jgi:hypothetical protein
MVEPLQWHSYLNFSHEVREERRCILSEKTKDFLSRLLMLAKEKRTKVLSSGTSLWRARIGGEPVPIGEDDWALEVFPVQQMGAPPPNEAKGGRIDFKGIPVLYVSSDPDTAMSEVRPWRGQEISLARLTLLREIMVIDFSTTSFNGTVGDLDLLFPCPHIHCNEFLSEAEHEEIAFRHIDHAFAKPVADTNDPVDYAPTQIIAEAIKFASYDGVCYRSSVADGLNYALFDTGCAKVEESEIRYTRSVKYQFSPKQFG